MPSATLKRSRAAKFDAPKRKKVKRQRAYHSSSSEDEDEVEDQHVVPVDQDEDEDEQEDEPQPGNASPEQMEDDNESESESESRSEGSDDSDVESTPGKKRKRNDPTAFATSMSKILGSKLTTAKRADPVLSRSKEAADAVKEIANEKLEAKARRQLRAEKKEKLRSGRITDIKGLNTPEVSTAQLLETEKKLRKVAQRGVIKLFNAVRAAQVKGEEAARDARRVGLVGLDKREEKVNEMSKKGFLELIAGGGKK